MDIGGITQPGFLRFMYIIFSQTAPFILLGLLLVGWLKILIPVDRIHGYLGHQNLRSALYAALFGLPLPLCSCSIIPVALGLRDKKASRESLLSFMISSPETSLDTIILSWGLLGPLMAVLRPVTAFLSSLFSAVLSISERTDRPAADEEYCGSSGDQSEDIDAYSERAYHVVGVKGFWNSLKNGTRSVLRRLPLAGKTYKEKNGEEEPTVAFGVLIRDSLHYGFTYMLDNFSLWFVIGIITSALIGVFVPEGWFENIPGGQVTEIIFMLLISVPMYVCSFESTPIAAMLILKGLSPGAALVFLLAGPATNISTIILLLKFFGKKFMSLYLSGICIVTVAAGLLLNVFLNTTDINIIRHYITVPVSPFRHWMSVVCAAVLLVLLILSFSRMDWRSFGKRWMRGMHSVGIVKKMSESKTGEATYRLNRKKLFYRFLPVMLIIYLLTGIYRVDPGNEGFRFTLGRMSQVAIQPGLHYAIPKPFEQVEIRPVTEVKSVEIGYTLTRELLEKWREHTLARESSEWHSFFTKIQTNQEQALYLLGDENQIEAKFSLHYRIQNPVNYYYRIEETEVIITLALENALRKDLASREIDDVLTKNRKTMVPSVIASVQALLDSWNTGVDVLALYIVDLHPPVEAVASFRDVASAMEDRQTAIHYAFGSREAAIPGARGKASRIMEEARSLGLEKITEAEQKAEVFQRMDQSFSLYPEESRIRMYLESLEKVLPGKRKIIVPGDVRNTGQVRIWSGFTGSITGVTGND